MRRILPLLCLTFAGCNAPIAAFMDTCFPSRAKSAPGPGVDVRPPPADPIGPGPTVPPGPNPPNPNPIPPPDFVASP